MLTGKQKRFLRSRAHHLDPIFQVGKGGVNENMIKQINDALEKRELLKVSVLQNCEDDRDEVAEQLCQGTHAELVQVIGHTIVLYKESKENKQLVLPS
jgi:RNA-binding protein